MKTVQTNNAPKAIGPYSQAIIINDIIYTSGQIPLNPKTMELESFDIVGQTNQVLENVKAILTEANTSLNNVIKTTIFIKDMNDFATINKIYSTYFNDHKPARSCVEVARLPKDVLIEMEVIAKIK